MAETHFIEVAGYPAYEVSREGVIRNKTTKKALAIVNQEGYPRLSLSSGPNRKMLYVHRVVALAFVPNDDPENKKQVDHRDRNIRNFHATNLEWVTPSENARRRVVGPSNKRGRAVWQLNPDTGEVIAEHCSLQAAARAVGLARASSLHGAVDQPGSTAGGFRWVSTPPEIKAAEEEWRELIEIEGETYRYLRYAISRSGRIRRVGGRELTPYVDLSGYATIQLRPRPCVTRSLRINRLVAHLFIPRPPEGDLEVDHIDGNPANNNASNLQWLSKKDHAAKTNGKKVRQVCPRTGKVVAEYSTIKAAAAAVGRRPPNIWAALQDENRTSAGFHWKYDSPSMAKKEPSLLLDDGGAKGPPLPDDGTSAPFAAQELTRLREDKEEPQLSNKDVEILLGAWGIPRSSEDEKEVPLADEDIEALLDAWELARPSEVENVGHLL